MMTAVTATMTAAMTAKTQCYQCTDRNDTKTQLLPCACAHVQNIKYAVIAVIAVINNYISK